MSDLFASINSEDEIYDLAEIDSDVVISNLLGDIKKLQAENAEFKKQCKRSDLKESWNLFFDWYSGYCCFDDTRRSFPRITYNREDMRYAYQAGYEAALPAQPDGERYEP